MTGHDHEPGGPVRGPTEQGRAGGARHLQLGDGRRMTVRPLDFTDRDGYAQAVAALSPDSLYRRFASPKPRLTDAELDYFTHPDGDRHVAFVAVEDSVRRGAGVSRYVRLVDEPDVADVAIAVGDAWQGQGLGRVLLERLVGHATAAGLTALVAMTLAENRPAAALLQAVGFQLTERDGAYHHYRLGLPRSGGEGVVSPDRE